MKASTSEHTNLWTFHQVKNRRFSFVSNFIQARHKLEMKCLQLLVVLTLCHFVTCRKFAVEDSRELVANFLSVLMKNWIKKHQERSNVAIINLGDDDYLAKLMAKRLHYEFPVIFPTRAIKEKIKAGKVRFIIIVSDNFDTVSEWI